MKRLLGWRAAAPGGPCREARTGADSREGRLKDGRDRSSGIALEGPQEPQECAVAFHAAVGGGVNLGRLAEYRP